MKTIKKLICKLFGHKRDGWSYVCNRCWKTLPPTLK